MKAPTVTTMFCYLSAFAGDCVILKDAAGETVKAKSLPIHYDVFARRVMRSKAWRMDYYGPGSFTFARK